MQSKTSFFNATVWRKNITRFWPIWAAYLALWILVLPREMLDNAYSASSVIRLNNYVYDCAGAPTVVISFFYAIVVGVAVFSYMHSAKAVSLMHAMPVKRETLFLSNFAAIVPFAIIPNVIIALLSIGAGALLGVNVVCSVLAWLYSSCITVLLFFAIASLCATVTGNIVAQGVLYFIVNLVVIVVEYMVRYIGSIVIFGMSDASRRTTFDALSPVYYLASGNRLVDVNYNPAAEIGESSFIGWGVLGIYLAAAVVITLAAMAFYHYRRSEATGDVVAVKWLKPVFKYCLTFGCAMTIGVGLFEVCSNRFSGNYMTMADVLTLTVWMMLAAAVGYIAGEMLIKKTLRIFRKRMFFGLVVSLVVVAVIMCLAGLDVLGLENRMPDPEQVESVQINSEGYYSEKDFSSDSVTDAMELHRMVLDSKDEIIANERDYREQAVTEEYFAGATEIEYDEESSFNLRFTYYLEDGGSFTRVYRGIPATVETEKDESTVVGRYLAMCNTPEQCLRRVKTEGEPYSAYINSVEGEHYFSAADAEKLYEAALKDAADGTVNVVYAVYSYEYATHNYNDNMLHVSFRSEDAQDYYGWSTIVMTTDAVNTLKALSETDFDMSLLMTDHETALYWGEQDQAYLK